MDVVSNEADLLSFYEPDNCKVEYIEIELKGGLRVCLPLDWYSSTDELVQQTERILYITQG